MTWETDPDEPLRREIKWSTIGAGIGLVFFIIWGAPLCPLAGWIIGWCFAWLWNNDAKAE